MTLDRDGDGINGGRGESHSFRNYCNMPIAACSMEIMLQYNYSTTIYSMILKIIVIQLWNLYHLFHRIRFNITYV